MSPSLSSPNSRGGLATLCCVAVLGLNGCVTARIEAARHSTTGMDAGDGVVILTKRQNVDYQTEGGFVNCVSNALQSGARKLNMQSEGAFMDMLFPWFEPAYAPSHAEGLRDLLARPGVADTIADSGVRYLVWIDGVTEVVDGGGSLSCTISAGGAGCFGFQWWENDSSYEAAVWDLETVEHAGTISADAVGTSYMPAVVVPIPLLARTKNAACTGLAKQLRAFLLADVE